MAWLYFAIAGYFLNALAALGDKIVLGKVLPKPIGYAFWQGILSVAVVLIIPFGFSIIGSQHIAASLAAGALWTVGLYFFFEALFLSDASRTLPIILSLSPLFLFAFETIGFRTGFTGGEFIGAILLVAGSVFLSLDFENREDYRIHIFSLFAGLAALFFSLSLFLIKDLFSKETFLNVFIWSRFGMVVGALLFLIFPGMRREIFSVTEFIRKPRHVGSIITVKILGSAGGLLIYFAIARASVTLVNALEGIQYAFIFILALLASIYWPRLIRESFGFKTLVQKISGILLVSAGLFFLYFHIS